MKIPLFKFPTDDSKFSETKKYEIWNKPKKRNKRQYIKKIYSLFWMNLYKKKGDINKEIGPVRIASDSNIP